MVQSRRMGKDTPAKLTKIKPGKVCSYQAKGNFKRKIFIRDRGST